jgi:hypothetical protein
MDHPHPPHRSFARIFARLCGLCAHDATMDDNSKPPPMLFSFVPPLRPTPSRYPDTPESRVRSKPIPIAESPYAITSDCLYLPQSGPNWQEGTISFLNVTLNSVSSDSPSCSAYDERQTNPEVFAIERAVKNTSGRPNSSFGLSLRTLHFVRLVTTDSTTSCSQDVQREFLLWIPSARALALAQYRAVYLLRYFSMQFKMLFTTKLSSSLSTARFSVRCISVRWCTSPSFHHGLDSAIAVTRDR